MHFRCETNHEEKGLDPAGMIRAVQTPPFERIGIMDLAAFYPPRDRFELAMRLNNLLAPPGFEAWLLMRPTIFPEIKARISFSQYGSDSLD